MDLRYLTDETLLKDTDRHVREEREKLTVILHHLKEVERRRLFSVVKCESIYEFATKHCGYSEDQASRRVAAMRLLKDLPQLEDLVNQGELNVTLMGMAQSLFNQERKAGREFSAEQKEEVIHEIAGHSKREAEQILQQHSPEPIQPKESSRPVGPNMTARKIVLPNETNEKLEKLKRMHAHKKLSTAELIDYLCELGLQELTKTPARPKADSKAEIRRQVLKRDNDCCTLCGSDFAIQVDHIIPKAMGGTYALDNLRVLCRHCNQREAIEKLGQDKMDRYINMC